VVGPVASELIRNEAVDIGASERKQIGSAGILGQQPRCFQVAGDGLGAPVAGTKTSSEGPQEKIVSAARRRSHPPRV
jgi:hypothetical protein